jgi:hypothetical protein
VEALIRAFELRRTTDEKDPAGIVGTRVGPYVIPDRLKLQSSPIWVYTRLRSELIPDVSKGQVKPDDPTYASKAIENGNTRPTIAVGGLYTWTIGKALVLGPYLQAGSVVGDLPDSRGSFTDHLFYGAGFSMQTNYAVADIDVQNSVATVVGALNVGYGYERFLGRYTPDPMKPDVRVATEDAARLQVEARLNWSKLDSKAIKPFVFLALDRSIHGSLHRDRGGILFEVDLDKVFGSAVSSAEKTAGVSTSSTSSTAK